MSNLIDPATGQQLPTDAIQRVLFVARPVHVYAIPPLTSMKGYKAAEWTEPDPRTGQSRQIFTARLRILETAIPAPITAGGDQQQEQVKTDIVLEDADSGALFAAAPYTDPEAVEHVLDSSRFFAIRVVGEGRKAVLGIGFEDRSEAFDFGVTLQEARKVLGFSDSTEATVSGLRGAKQSSSSKPQPEKAPSKDYSLKPGQTITVDIGSKRRSAEIKNTFSSTTGQEDDQRALFSIPPPPGPATGIVFDNSGDDSSAFPILAPPPSARDTRSERRRPRPQSALLAGQKDEFGFDDGEFGEFK
ncbi:hypothetical protein DTO166G4_2370 [Paecilomyces variotii]|nr:hypothetical protein DTO166G4_2370 [Paecilomyces variotii]KAJ9234314.1 hypothetical protein DTO169E5_6658 [Paecilomyces variotii]KAJ9240677.1 hypothetical protein DTO166G5_1486 [Paecilomyces variotii]KAJ9305018.1 hypothetical protein DTO217A2_5510 [Paecilomyces variotii]